MKKRNLPAFCKEILLLEILFCVRINIKIKLGKLGNLLVPCILARCNI